MSAALRDMLAAPRDVSVAPSNMLVTQDFHGNSRGLEGPLGEGGWGKIHDKFFRV